MVTGIQHGIQHLAAFSLCEVPWDELQSQLGAKEVSEGIHLLQKRSQQVDLLARCHIGFPNKLLAVTTHFGIQVGPVEKAALLLHAADIAEEREVQ